MPRSQIVHENFLRRVESRDFPAGTEPVSGLDAADAQRLFRAQCLSRALDIVSRQMQKAGQGFYTIGSSGHEGMAAVAHALRPTDPALLHYRDAAFQIARADQVPGQDMARDMLLSFALSSDDPISGGRHKVLGSRALNIPPQTSTIASHLPKAVGLAHAIALARRQPPEHRAYPDDSIVVCSFGDASANHSTAQGAINTASWMAYQALPLPILFICEDNGIGISTRTPKGWIESSLSQRPGIRYFAADGLDLYQTHSVTREAVEFVRMRRKPALLHLRTVRLYGHAGADLPTTYMSREEVEAEEANDPLLHSVRLLSMAGALDPDGAVRIYEETLQNVSILAEKMVKRPRLQTGAQVAASLVPPPRDCVKRNAPSETDRAEAFGPDLRAQQEPQPMSRLINWALTDLMLEHPEIVLMGEDIGRKGGVYGVTQKLQARFGPARVMDTLLDEQSILGLALGMAQNGFVPVPEIQFLAYLHNAEDQLRGEAATLPFFSNGQFTNPMVVRIAGLGYQRGFGGHFHNDNSIAVLRDIPGVVIACPSNGADAVLMLRECLRLAGEENRVCVFLEPIALYPMRDLLEDRDGGWMRLYPGPNERISLGEIGVEGQGRQLAVVSYGNGFYLSTKARAQLEAEGIALRLIDLRWLAPLPETELLEATRDCDHILVVDECRRTGSQSEALMTLFAEAGRSSLARVTADDCFIATGPAYAATLPSVEGIVAAAKVLVGRL